jgi:uncharacterized protein (TIGR02271 family)
MIPNGQIPMITTNDLDTLLTRGGDVLGQDGKKIGKIGQVYLNDATGEPEWVTAHTGLFGGGESFIPLEHASVQGEDITVPYTKEQVKDAPHSNDVDGSLEVDQEADLYRHYGMADPYAGHDQDATPDQASGQGQGQQLYDQDADQVGAAGGAVQDADVETSTTGRDAAGNGATVPDTTGHDATGDVGHDTSGPNTDDAITRSEERLHVGTRQQETGKARLRKYIVTEQQTTTVPVSHDEVHVTREPITDANVDDALSGGELTEEEHEVTLHADQVVTEKETVPVERIRLGTETVTEQQEVTEDVRKEQVDFDGTDGTDVTGTDATGSTDTAGNGRHSDGTDTTGR